MAYYFTKTVSMPFYRAVERVKEELRREGFGVLTEIDVKDTLKKRLGVNFREYRILGVCNAPFAYQALGEEDKIGTMLPCNIIVQRVSRNEVEVAAIDPVASMQAVENPNLAEVAEKVQKMLKDVVGRI
jgi:uncharacterized protein (DUF302 family)